MRGCYVIHASVSRSPVLGVGCMYQSFAGVSFAGRAKSYLDVFDMVYRGNDYAYLESKQTFSFHGRVGDSFARFNYKYAVEVTYCDDDGSVCVCLFIAPIDAREGCKIPVGDENIRPVSAAWREFPDDCIIYEGGVLCVLDACASALARINSLRSVILNRPENAKIMVCVDSM